MIALAHIEAPGVAEIGRIGEVTVLLGTDRAAAVARLFERDAVLVALRDIKEGPAIGAEEPLIGREGDEVRIERADIDGSTPAPCVASRKIAAPCLRAVGTIRFISSATPSAQCTVEIETSASGGAPGRSSAARTAVVQS